MVIRRVVPGLVIAALLALVSATPATAARGMEVAVQDDKVFVSNEAPGVEHGLDLARQMGATTVRALLAWDETPDFFAHDRLVAAAAARGMRVQFSLTGTPRWGGSTKATDTLRPSAARFATFAARVAAHYRGRVGSYSIWNEPNWHTWIRPARTAPTQYRALYTAGYKAIKQADPAAKVLIGELAPHVNPPQSIGPLTFLQKLGCKRCKPLVTDGVALHPYEFKHAPSWRGVRAGSVTIGTLGRMTTELRRLAKRGVLKQPGGGAPPVHLTEFGYFASGPRATPKRLRARWMPQAFQIALRNPRVRQMTLFGLIRNPGESWDVGIVARSGRPEPAFHALRRWTDARARRALIAGPLGTLP